MPSAAPYKPARKLVLSLIACSLFFQQQRQPVLSISEHCQWQCITSWALWQATSSSEQRVIRQQDQGIGQGSKGNSNGANSPNIFSFCCCCRCYPCAPGSEWTTCLVSRNRSSYKVPHIYPKITIPVYMLAAGKPASNLL